jgi:hypothetical protein
MTTSRLLIDLGDSTPALPVSPRVDALLQRPHRHQVELGVFTLDNRVPADHSVREIDAVIAGLDLTALDATIRSNAEAGGRPAIDPRILLTLWVYGSTQGEVEASEIARRTRTEGIGNPTGHPRRHGPTRGCRNLMDANPRSGGSPQNSRESLVDRLQRHICPARNAALIAPLPRDDAIHPSRTTPSRTVACPPHPGAPQSTRPGCSNEFHRRHHPVGLGLRLALVGLYAHVSARLPPPLFATVSIAPDRGARQGGVPGAPADTHGSAYFVHWMLCRPERTGAREGAALDVLSPQRRRVLRSPRRRPGHRRLGQGRRGSRARLLRERLGPRGDGHPDRRPVAVSERVIRPPEQTCARVVPG